MGRCPVATDDSIIIHIVYVLNTMLQAAGILDWLRDALEAQQESRIVLAPSAAFGLPEHR